MSNNRGSVHNFNNNRYASNNLAQGHLETKSKDDPRIKEK